MTKIWFTSDTHYGHENIIKYSNRPFKTVEEMNKRLIINANNRVKKTDTIFHLGDFCFKNTLNGKKGEGLINPAEYYLNQLNGRYVNICGNHDYNNSLNTPILGIVIEHGGHLMWLTHQPKDYNPKYSINLVGHVHKLWKFKQLVDGTILVNVGVDQWDFRPINITEILRALSKWRKVMLKTNYEVKQ